MQSLLAQVGIVEALRKLMPERKPGELLAAERLRGVIKTIVTVRVSVFVPKFPPCGARNGCTWHCKAGCLIQAILTVLYSFCSAGKGACHGKGLW